MGMEPTISTVLLTLQGREVYSAWTPGGGSLSVLSTTLCIGDDTPQKIENSSMLLFSTCE